MKQLVVLVAILISLGAFTQEVMIEAIPPTYLEFAHPPFVADGMIVGPLREVLVALGWNIETSPTAIKISKGSDEVELDLTYVPQNEDEEKICRYFFQLKDFVNGGKVTFIPLRFLAKFLSEEITLNGNLLSIGGKTWLVDKKLIVTNLKEQKVYAFEGLTQTNQFRICSGKPSTPTPRGIFEVYRKWPGWHAWKATKKVPYDGKMYNAIYFYGGAAFHGSYEMRKHPSSHGCPRMFLKDIDLLYAWTPGTPGENHYIPKLERITVYVL